MKELAEIFKALGDETRLEIVKMLKGRELCVCDIMDAFKLSQPAISHHLKILRQAGIIVDSRAGKWIYYSLNNEIFDVLQSFSQEVYPGDIETLRCRPASLNKL